MWSAVAAERLGIIGRRELLAPHGRARSRRSRRMETYDGHGPVLQLVRPPHRGEDDDGQRRRAARADPVVRRQRLARGRPEDRRRARAAAARRARARSTTRWTSASTTGPTVNRILFHYEPGTGDAPCCYDTIVSESRIAYYVGVAKGDLPSKVFYGQWRTFPDTCQYNFQETRPAGLHAHVRGRDRLRGHATRTASGRLVPSWGGSMFEALMPPLFVPEEEWGPASWRVNHPQHRRRADRPRASTSPATARGASRRPRTREGGYGIFGVDAVGMDPNGNASNIDPHAGRPRVRRPGLPAAGDARSAAERLHERDRHAARHVPRPALAAARGARLAREARARLRRVHEVGLLRRGERATAARSTRTRSSRSTRG